jgi:outer membrane immunogenic protein
VKKTLATIAAIIAALFVTPVLAADMAIKAPPPAPATASNWTGFYAGANIGGGWGHSNVNYVPNDPASAILLAVGAEPNPASFPTAGVLGGLQAGYNWQINSNWLIGAETDFDWSGMRGSGSTNPPNFVTFPWTATASERLDWFGTVRARLGYLVTENLLTYVTGGLAYGRVEQSGGIVNNSGAVFVNGPAGGFSSICNPFGTCFTGSTGNVATGWTAGAALNTRCGNVGPSKRSTCM